MNVSTRDSIPSVMGAHCGLDPYFSVRNCKSCWLESFGFISGYDLQKKGEFYPFKFLDG